MRVEGSTQLYQGAIQLIARRDDDARLMSLAGQYERATVGGEE